MDELTTTAAGPLAQQDPRRLLVQAVLDGLQSAHTRRAYGRALEDFLTWHDGQGQPPLTKAVIQAYKAHLVSRGQGPASINQALSAIRTLIREAADNGLVGQAAAQAIANVKGQKSEALPAGRALSPGELAALLATCGATTAGVRDAAIIGLLYVCGLRRSELTGLDLADYNPAGAELKVRAGKGNKARLGYLEAGAAAALADWLLIRGDWPGPLFCPVYRSGNLHRARLTSQAIYHLLQKRAAAAGIDVHLSPHDFRRSFISDLLDAGADIVTVQKMAGHANVTTTARYDRRPEEAKRKAAGLLHVPYRSRINRMNDV